MTTLTIEYVKTPHTAISEFITAIGTHGNTAFKNDAIEVAKANKGAASNPAKWAALRIALVDDLHSVPEGNRESLTKMLAEKLAPKQVTNYTNQAKNALIWLIVTSPSEATVKATTLENMSKGGIELLQTRGEKGGFVQGYAPSNSSKVALVKAGINPDTGFKMTNKERDDYVKLEKDEKARVKSEKDAAATRATDTPASKVAHIADREHKIENLCSEIARAIDPDNSELWGLDKYAELLARILVVLQPASELEKAA